nr:putative neutral sphingomyelinase [Leptinotarsa decemlineata]
MSLEFKVFTLNCWGIAVVSKDRKKRMQAIAEYLATSHYDVVCLQEVWTDRDFFLIRDKVVGVFPYSHYFYSGVTGSGVCILSRHRFEETFFHQWSLNGYIHKLHHGDWFGGKGVGLCTMKVNNFRINVYTAHLHAEYNRNSDEYEAHRILQAYDTAQFIMLTSQSADLTVLAGDLNTEPGDLAYRVMLAVPGLVDSFESFDIQEEQGATFANPKNSYTPRCSGRKNPGQRIDYIMYHPGSRLQVDLKSYKVPLPDRVPHQSCSYSDHEAIEATLEISQKTMESFSRDQENLKSVLKDCLNVVDHALNKLITHKIVYFTFAIILFIVLLVSLIFDAPEGFFVVFSVLRALIVVLITFCLLMATIWNKMEKHGVLAGKLAIEMSLKKHTNL